MTKRKKKKKKLKTLIRFHSANKIDIHNRWGKKKQKKGGEKSNRIYRDSQNQNNKCFTWVTAVRVLSLFGGHNPPHPSRRSPNTVLISGPAVGAAQIVIQS